MYNKNIYQDDSFIIRVINSFNVLFLFKRTVVLSYYISWKLLFFIINETTMCHKYAINLFILLIQLYFTQKKTVTAIPCIINDDLHTFMLTGNALLCLINPCFCCSLFPSKVLEIAFLSLTQRANRGVLLI